MEAAVNSQGRAGRLAGWAAAYPQVAVFLVALVILSATSADRLLKQSQAPHFVYQADAFLHGQLHLRVKPPNDNDWIYYQGKYYVSFPPVPAVLMTPLVAVFGLGFNDVLFTLPFAAFNIMMMLVLLERLRREKLSSLGLRENLWLTALFGFGTVNYSASILGEVWFTAHVLALSFTFLYIHFAWRARHPLLAGLFLALAFDTRTNLAFTAIFFALQLIFPRRPGGWLAFPLKEVLARGVRFSLPILIVGGLQMAMNQARFGNPFEYGHSFLGGPAGARIKQHGLFAYHYLWWNLSTMLLGLPKITDKFPFVDYDPNGMSVFLTTPLLLWLLWPKRKPLDYKIFWATALAGLLPCLFYQNSGYVQFGFRFALDVMPYLIMILVTGGLEIKRREEILIALSILINFAGAISFKRSGPV